MSSSQGHFIRPPPSSMERRRVSIDRGSKDVVTKDRSNSEPQPVVYRKIRTQKRSKSDTECVSIVMRDRLCIELDKQDMDTFELSEQNFKLKKNAILFKQGYQSLEDTHVDMDSFTEKDTLKDTLNATSNATKPRRGIKRVMHAIRKAFRA